MIVKRVKYKHFGECIFLSNGELEIVIPLEFGLRVLKFSLRGKDNIFYEQPSNDKQFINPSTSWRLYGGHRLWIAPESDKSYYGDNDPISYEIVNNGVNLFQALDPMLNIKKSMKIQFCKEKDSLIIEHIVKNYDNKPQKLGIWAITTVRENGYQVIPFDSDMLGYPPNRHVSLWDTFQLSDPRISFKDNNVIIRHIPIKNSGKVGFSCHAGYVECYLDSVIFTKQFAPFNPDFVYPDNNVNYEVYLSTKMMEMETLSPFHTVSPDQSVSHVEKWTLRKDENTCN